MRAWAGWVVLKNLLLFLVTLGTALPMHDTLWAFSGRDVRLARAGGVGASGGVMYGELYWMVVTPCNMLCGTPLVQTLCRVRLTVVAFGAGRGYIRTCLRRTSWCVQTESQRIRKR